MRSASVLRFSGLRRTASDFERSLDFYTQALGFTVAPFPPVGHLPAEEMMSRVPTRHAHLVLGHESIELVAPVGYERHPGSDGSVDAVADPAFHHLAIVTNDMAAALGRLRRYSPAAISTDGPVRLPKAAGGVSAFKFRDPDGHPLELICFPPGVGDPRWQATATGPTLGIDHTAITISNVARSLAFYVDALGFKIQSRQVNQGSEQARLDGVDRAEVEVIGLTPSEAPTPHLELLGYRVPAVARIHPLPPLADDHADLMNFVVDDLPTLLARLEGTGTECRSLDPQTLLLRDNDGHLLRLRAART